MDMDSYDALRGDAFSLCGTMWPMSRRLHRELPSSRAPRIEEQSGCPAIISATVGATRAGFQGTGDKIVTVHAV